jgi:hypothetical protein
MRRASSDWVQPLSFRAACNRRANSIRIASGGAPHDAKPLRGGGMVLLRHAVTLEHWYDRLVNWSSRCSEPTRYVVERYLSTVPAPPTHS